MQLVAMPSNCIVLVCCPGMLVGWVDIIPIRELGGGGGGTETLNVLQFIGAIFMQIGSAM